MYSLNLFIGTNLLNLLPVFDYFQAIYSQPFLGLFFFWIAITGFLYYALFI